MIIDGLPAFLLLLPLSCTLIPRVLQPVRCTTNWRATLRPTNDFVGNRDVNLSEQIKETWSRMDKMRSDYDLSKNFAAFVVVLP
jgi:hypothetical protein